MHPHLHQTAKVRGAHGNAESRCYVGNDLCVSSSLLMYEIQINTLAAVYCLQQLGKLIRQAHVKEGAPRARQPMCRQQPARSALAARRPRLLDHAIFSHLLLRPRLPK